MRSIEKALQSEAAKVARLLKKNKSKIVFAESCTGGMVSATLVEIPGISDYLCGSAVVYRPDTKAKWLGLSLKFIENTGGVAEDLSAEMAESILKKTPEADIAAAITGHLGPKAPRSQLGQLYIAVVMRGTKRVHVQEFRAIPKSTRSKIKSRKERQLLASHAVLFMVRSLLEFDATRSKPRRS